MIKQEEKSLLNTFTMHTLKVILEHDHTHSANQRREFSCSIFHKLSGITSISMLYIEHTNDI